MKNRIIVTSRSIATILVLLGHCFYGFGGWNFDLKASPLAPILSEYIYSFHMAFFMILSGFVFALAYSNKELYLIKFVKNRLLRLIVPLLFIKYCVWNPVNLLIGNYSLNDKSNLLIELGHLWYLAVLFAVSVGMYILMIIRNNIKSASVRRWFYMIVVFISALVASGTNILPSFGKSTVVSLYRYQFFFLIGFIIQKKNIVEFTNKAWVGIVFLLAHLVLFGYSLSSNSNSIFYRNLVGVFGCGFWLCLCQAISKCRGKLDAVFNFIDGYSMGIYLFHPPIIYLLLGMTSVSNMPIVVMILVLFVVGFVGSVFTTFALRKIKLQKLIGEK